MRRVAVVLMCIAGLSLSGCAAVATAYPNAETPEQCHEAAKDAQFAAFTSSSNPGAALVATLLSAGTTAATVKDTLDKCLERVGGTSVPQTAEAFSGDATREDYVPELSEPEVAPTVRERRCSAVLVGGSGYCLN